MRKRSAHFSFAGESTAIDARPPLRRWLIPPAARLTHTQVTMSVEGDDKDERGIGTPAFESSCMRVCSAPVPRQMQYGGAAAAAAAGRRNCLVPALGLCWANAINLSIILRRADGYDTRGSGAALSARRELCIVFAPHLACGVAEYTIDGGGVVPWYGEACA